MVGLINSQSRVCVANQHHSLPSPFGNEWIIGSFGLLIVIMLVIPLGLTNLDDNMGVQYVAFCVSIIMAAQWMSTSFIAGFDSSRLVAAAPVGLQYGQVVGTVMLNFAIVTIIPSWINIKRKDVSVQNSVWTTILAVTCFYIISGMICMHIFANY
jgi:hypothetical protein